MVARSRSEALAMGLTRFFTGRACRRGHRSERQASGGQCVECQQLHQKTFHQRHPRRNAMYRRKHYAAHNAEHIAGVLASRNKHPDQWNAYRRAWYRRNAERQQEKAREWRQRHPLTAAQRGAAVTRARRWVIENPDRRRAIARSWVRNNPEKVNARTARRRAAQLQATPPWVDHTAINAFYMEAARLTRETGIPHDVDHIEPLNGAIACGLHVPWNLRVIPAVENRRKGNRRFAE